MRGSEPFSSVLTTPRLARAERGSVLAYLQRLSGYSGAQITRLVLRWEAGRPLVEN